MKKRWTGLLLSAALLAVGAPGAMAVSYSFPHEGLRLAAEEDWTLLTPATLAEHAPMLRELGVDAALMEADWAASQTVLELFLPEGVQVALSAAETEQTAAWGDMVSMPEAEKRAVLEALSQAPYEHTAWAEDMPGYIRYDWALQAGGIPVSFAGLSTVRQGRLYTLTAKGASVSLDTLHETNARILAGIEYLGGTAQAQEAEKSATPPQAVADDGVVTPIAVEGFDGISYDEMTQLTVRTLPGAELMLQTPTDMLRGKADGEGLHRYSVSTKRETAYTYTLTAQAEGREASTITVVVERRLTPEAQAEAYRKSARQLYVYGYANLLANPGAFADEPVTFRGRVGDFADLEGFPCVLIYTENPGKGVWRNPMWVVLTEPDTLAVDDIRTVYGDLRGDTLAYTDENGEEQQAPVVIGRIVSE